MRRGCAFANEGSLHGPQPPRRTISSSFLTSARLPWAYSGSVPDKAQFRALRLRVSTSPGRKSHHLERFMLAEIVALHQQWLAAERRASTAERSLMDTLRGGAPAQSSEVKAVCALRRNASASLQAFLAAAEKGSQSCRMN